MQKVVTCTVHDLLFDREAVATMLNGACTGRQSKYRVRGACQLDGTVYFVLLPVAEEQPLESYVLAEIADTTPEGVATALHERWTAGFDTVGSLRLPETYLMLYARREDERS